MYFITNVLRSFSLILLFTLSACGGGGGDSGPSLSLSTYALTFTASHSDSVPPASQTVTATLNGDVSGVLFVRIVITGMAVTIPPDISFSGRTGVATIQPASPDSLAIGTHTSTITVTACTSDIMCTSGVIGTPQTIIVTYTVT